MLQKAYRDAGLSDEFIRRVLEALADQVWYPATSELVSDGWLRTISYELSR